MSKRYEKIADADMAHLDLIGIDPEDFNQLDFRYWGGHYDRMMLWIYRGLILPTEGQNGDWLLDKIVHDRNWFGIFTDLQEKSWMP